MYKRQAYWVSETIRNIFKIGILSDFVPVRKGIDTGKNELFLRFWHEVSFSKFSHLSFERKWFIYIKGGTLRKWYGNVDLIVNWENNGQDIKNYKGSTIRNQSFIKKEAITWSLTGSNGFGARYIPINCVFDNNGSSVFPLKNFEFILGSLNSIVSETILAILNPTLAFQVGDIARLPIKWDNDFRQKEIIKSNISISKTDWDSHEISWGFTESPLINDYKKISKSYEKWLTDVTRDFFQLHTNEEELNRIFIEIYGLQNELTPEISLKNITILQDELDYNALEQLRPPYEGQLVPVKRTVVMQQLISYAIGCFMGRYRLDKPGLQIAHPNPTKDETAGYSYNECSFEIDDDGIVPIMGSGCDFPDDAVTRFKNFLDVVWGEDTRIENVNFLQECLDQDVEKFMVKDFWKVHCKMYSKKPIYWLFSSPKGAFQVLAYMHRMNAFTVEKIRSKYLIEHLKSLRSKISLLEKSESSLSATESRVLDKLRRDIQECEHYDMTLKTVADMQINFDLDDGVTENYKLFKGVVAEIK